MACEAMMRAPTLRHPKASIFSWDQGGGGGNRGPGKVMQPLEIFSVDKNMDMQFG